MLFLLQDTKPFKCSSPNSLPGAAPGGKVSPHPSLNSVNPNRNFPPVGVPSGLTSHPSLSETLPPSSSQSQSQIYVYVCVSVPGGLRPNPTAAAGLPPGMPTFPFPPEAAAAYASGMNGLFPGNLSPVAANGTAGGLRASQMDALRMAQQLGPHAIAAMGLAAHPALAAAAAAQGQSLL